MAVFGVSPREENGPTLTEETRRTTTVSRRLPMTHVATRLALALALLLPITLSAARADSAHTYTIEVAGSGVDELDRAIVHSAHPTATGVVQRSTETVELHGSLEGRVLYHVTSVFDYVHQTLVN